MFRVDASIEIGTGHVMRCLTLAEKLASEGHQCHFICRHATEHLSGLIVNKGFSLHLLAGRVNKPGYNPQVTDISYSDWLSVTWQEDAEQTAKILSSLKPDWLIIDHYALDSKWQRQVHLLVDRIMVIDDLANRSHECALLLDQNLGRVLADYEDLSPPECTKLIGPAFALLRPEFAAFRQRSLRRRRGGELKRILISLGGADQVNATSQVLKALATSPLFDITELDIVMGASAPYLQEVREIAAGLPFNATVSTAVANMAERMCQADLSIGAAGGTSWERCCLGLPVVLVTLAENQLPGARALQAAGAAISVGWPAALDEALPLAISEVGKPETLRRMSEAAAKVTEGEGVSRVFEAMIGSSGGQGV